MTGQSRPYTLTRTIDGTSFTMETTSSDALNRPLAFEYPDGEIVTMSYDHEGLEILTAGNDTLVTAVTYNGMGQLARFNRGNDVDTWYTYYDEDDNFRVSDHPDNGNNGLFYYHDDHLNSATFLSKTDGQAKTGSWARYTAFGVYRTTPTTEITELGYTSHHENRYIKLVYMRARWYLPETGRFLSADTIVPDPSNPQDLNRYTYVRNNPIRYTDPTGHYIPEPPGGGGNYDCEGLEDCRTGGDEDVCFTRPTALDCLYPPGHEDDGELIVDGRIEDESDVTPYGIPDYRRGQQLAVLGLVFDVGELVLLKLGRTREAGVLGIMDLAVTFEACRSQGQCYFVRNEQGEIIGAVLNYDALVTIVDVILGFYPESDLETTKFSLVSDASTLFGLLPNLLSIQIEAGGIYLKLFDGRGSLVHEEFIPLGPVINP